MTEGVPAPKSDPLAEPRSVDPRPHDQLVADLMEARDCSKLDAEAFIETHGAARAERVVQARWLAGNGEGER